MSDDAYTNDTGNTLEVTVPVVATTAVSFDLEPGETLTRDRIDDAIATIQEAMDDNPVRGRDANCYFTIEGVPTGASAEVYAGPGTERSVPVPSGGTRKPYPAVMERLLRQAFQVERAAYDEGGAVEGADMIALFGDLRRQTKYVLTGEGGPSEDWEAMFDADVDLDAGLGHDPEPGGPAPATP